MKLTRAQVCMLQAIDTFGYGGWLKVEERYLTTTSSRLAILQVCNGLRRAGLIDPKLAPALTDAGRAAIKKADGS